MDYGLKYDLKDWLLCLLDYFADLDKGAKRGKRNYIVQCSFFFQYRGLVLKNIGSTLGDALIDQATVAALEGSKLAHQLISPLAAISSILYSRSVNERVRGLRI